MFFKRLTCFALLLMVGITFPTIAKAQSNSPKLEELVNPNQKQDVIFSTIEEYANDFYLKCATEEKNLAFNSFQLRHLCACISAKIPTLMTISDMRLLHVKNTSSREARTQYIAHLYTPCMLDAVEMKVSDACYKDQQVKKFPASYRKEACDCATQKTSEYMADKASAILTNLMIQDPYNLNPIDEFLFTPVFTRNQSKRLEDCRFDIQYKLDNRR